MLYSMNSRMIASYQSYDTALSWVHRRFPSVSGATRYSDPDLPQLLPLPARPSSSYEPRPKVWQISINWIYLDSWLQIMVILQWFSHGNTQKTPKVYGCFGEFWEFSHLNWDSWYYPYFIAEWMEPLLAHRLHSMRNMVRRTFLAILWKVKEAAQFTDDVMQAMAEKLGINVMATWQIIRRCWGRLEGDYDLWIAWGLTPLAVTTTD